jgi:hypothetical protein
MLTNEKIDACTTMTDLAKLVTADQLLTAAKFGLKQQLSRKNDREALKALKAQIAAGKIKIVDGVPVAVGK